MQLYITLHASVHVLSHVRQIDEGDDIPIEFETLLTRLKLQEPAETVEVSQTEPDAAPNTLVLFRVTSNPVVPTTTTATAAAAATDDDRSSSNSNDALKKKTSLQMSLICCNDQPYATQAVGQVTVTFVLVTFVTDIYIAFIAITACTLTVCYCSLHKHVCHSSALLYSMCTYTMLCVGVFLLYCYQSLGA
jgi:hypothetical protein